MLDLDLAALYGTETKRLKQQVRRNIGKFPEDFMFQLTMEERQALIEIYPHLSNLKYSNISPLAFTEQGVAMLSSVLTSQRALEINIDIMRAFVYYRSLLLESREFQKDLRALNEKLDRSFKYLLEKIDLLNQASSKRVRIKGFKLKK